CRVIFGVNCSPFLLGAVLQHLLQNMSESAEYNTELVIKLQESFYVDNCVTSVGSSSELYQFIDEATRIMASRKFDLRGWEYGGIGIKPSTAESINVLGLLWNPSTDTLQFSPPKILLLDEQKVTKRFILSAAHSL